LKCHDASTGDLLGAFSYTLRLSISCNTSGIRLGSCMDQALVVANAHTFRHSSQNRCGKPVSRRFFLRNVLEHSMIRLARSSVTKSAAQVGVVILGALAILPACAQDTEWGHINGRIVWGPKGNPPARGKGEPAFVMGEIAFTPPRE
jgi:hypothetical protein